MKMSRMRPPAVVAKTGSEGEAYAKEHAKEYGCHA